MKTSPPGAFKPTTFYVENAGPGTFTPHEIIASSGKRAAWKARREDGAQCLHEHRTHRGAVQCCDQLNKPTPTPGTPRGAYDAACGDHD